MMIINKHTPFWLFSLSVIFALTLPFLIQDGMFMDGALYTCVSHNLSIGNGTFWFPQFSKHNIAGLTSFHEQPPLVFGIQSIFFKVFGNSMYVERLYVLLALLITIWLINILWKEIFKDDDELKKMGWLPLFLWIINPVCVMTYRNNMQENTMGIFTLIAVIIILKAMRNNNLKSGYGILAGIFIFLATFSKGIPGLFPIFTPIIFWFITRKASLKNAVLLTVIATIIPVIIYGILCLFPESRESLSMYFIKRALHRIQEAPTVSNRFEILRHLLNYLSIAIFLTAAALIFAKFKKIKFNLSPNIKTSLFVLAVGLSASVPLILTKVQRGFYLVPSLPFFGVGLAILVAPLFIIFLQKLNLSSKLFRILFAAASVLFVSVIIFTILQKGKTWVEKEKLHDVYVVGQIVPKFSAIDVTAGMWDDWYLQCYLMRYFNISLDPHGNNSFFLADKSLHLNPDSSYKKVELQTLKYDLYKKI